MFSQFHVLSQPVFSTRTLSLLSSVTPPVYADMSCALFFSYRVSWCFSTHAQKWKLQQVSPPILTFNISHIIKIPEELPVWLVVCVMAFILTASLVKGIFQCSFGLEMKGILVYRFQSGFPQAIITFLFSILYKIEDWELNCQCWLHRYWGKKKVRKCKCKGFKNGKGILG